MDNIQDDYCDPDTLEDFGVFMSERQNEERAEREAREEELEVKRNRGDI